MNDASEIISTIKNRHEFSIETPGGVISTHDLLALLEVAEAECRKRSGIFSAEPIPPGVVTVRCDGSRFIASFEVEA